MTQNTEIDLGEDGLAALREWAATERPETAAAVAALADEVDLLRQRLAKVTLLAGHDVTMGIDGTRWVRAYPVFAAATGNDALLCRCGGRITTETRRGTKHQICGSCHVCAECDAAGRKTYGPHAGVSR